MCCGERKPQQSTACWWAFRTKGAMGQIKAQQVGTRSISHCWTTPAGSLCAPIFGGTNTPSIPYLPFTNNPPPPGATGRSQKNPKDPKEQPHTVVLVFWPPCCSSATLTLR